MADPALDVRGLTRRFGDRVAVRELDLTVQVGDVYGFLGPNGAGKTTAMRCIMGLIRKDAGTVEVFGRSGREARAHVGAIIEVPAFHGWMSGRDNLRQAAWYSGMGGAEAEREVSRVLERVGLGERGADHAAAYSHGMRQRLGIARALLGGPKLLMLDEPTNGLDPRGMREVRDLIRSLALHDAITVLISSHMLAEVQSVCNRVGIIQLGSLRAEGQVSQLLGRADGALLAEVGSVEAESLAAALEAMEGVHVVGPAQSGRTLVRVDAGGLAGLNRGLVERGVPVSALVPEERTLEDVFLEVTR